MSVAFVASLQTTRTMERGVSYHGATQGSVERPARTWLEAFGENGDSFIITENVPTQRIVIACEKPVAPEPEPQWKGHAFVAGKSPLRCNACNNIYGEHLKV